MDTGPIALTSTRYSPFSTGYGTGLGGVTALMNMLNACARGITVVNIDNGFRAGYIAALIVRSGQGVQAP